MKMLESQGYDPKPGDLTVGKMKQGENLVEVCRGSVCKRSSDLGLGVKGQSSLVIAGSCRNGPQSSLLGDY